MHCLHSRFYTVHADALSQLPDGQRNSDGMESGKKRNPSVSVRHSAPRIGEEIREAKVFLRQAEKAANRTKVTVYRVRQYLELTSC